MDLLEQILDFEENLQEPSGRSMTKGFLMDHLETLGTLGEVLEAGIPGSLWLSAL